MLRRNQQIAVRRTSIDGRPARASLPGRFHRADERPTGLRAAPPGAPRPHSASAFAEVASLIRVSPERNELRFCRLEVWPDLFGRALLVRHWGRLGTPGRRRLDPHPDPGAAINALARLLRAKRRRGYQERTDSAIFRVA
jgi:predicted DNA-binding WGR domain protein